MELPPTSLWPFWSFFLHIILLSSMDVPWLLGSAANFSNETDHLALLHFKHLITDDPLNSLSSWKHTLHFCHWQGVTCGGRRHPQRVTALELTGLNLVGPISPYISNLTFLRLIDLENNSFHGTVPEEIGRLSRLRVLDLVNNIFTGEISANLTSCSELTGIDLYGNQLVGKIPAEFGSLSKLTVLSIGHNDLTGSIPPSLGNLSSLTILYLSRNNLEGSIPDDLSKLVRLMDLSLDANELSGMIPPSLYNLSSIETLDVAANRLNGNLPPNLGFTLPNLQQLYAAINHFTGPIPVSLTNASGLVLIDFGLNNFSGSVPLNFGRLKDLSILDMGANELGFGKAHDLSFLDSLTNCSNLQEMDLGGNHLGGALPNSISNLSTQLRWLSFAANKISGIIPSGIENLVGLTRLDIRENVLTGSIPIGIGNLNKVVELDLSRNELSGQIPSSLGNLTSLSELHLFGNKLSGSLPSTLDNCINLQFIYIENNCFSGSLPKQLFSIPSLIELKAQNNFFTGYLPHEDGYLKVLGRLIVSNNKLSGEIPSSLSNCRSLEYLFLDGNFFQGSIPLTFGTLRGLQSLDLSHNNLSGEIPKFVENLSALWYLNLSFNNFEGELPEKGVFQNASEVSVLGNSKLCGGIRQFQLPACSSQASKKRGMSLASKIKITIIGVVMGLISLSCFLITLCWVRKSARKPVAMPSVGDPFMNISYVELFRATDGFSSANLIGTGNFGSVYKGTLDREGAVIAVKVFNFQQQGALRSFMAECKALRNIKHRNLIKIFTCCSSIDFKGNEFKALVFEYLPNGNLHEYLHRDGHDQLRRNLNFIQRLNIAVDVASSLDYLHHQCQTPIVHRDLKPSNILLDNDMTAHVGDFGLARVLSQVTQSSSVGVKGSIGYIAPEYALGGKASTQGDVYSFGILLLEMITGKGPTDNMFKDDLSLHRFAKLVLPERVMEIVDPFLLEEAEAIEESPRERMLMKDVVTEMHAIKDIYLGVRIQRVEQVRSQQLGEGPSYLSHY